MLTSQALLANYSQIGFGILLFLGVVSFIFFSSPTWLASSEGISLFLVLIYSTALTEKRMGDIFHPNGIKKVDEFTDFRIK